jgi:predicted aconitase with swiveling domain
MNRIARAYVAGEAEGEALVLAEPLSLWGGLDAQTGLVIDRSHPQRGASVAGRILVMPGARGSSSSSSVLAEAIRLGTAPCGVVLASPDPILTVGAIVARSLYDLACPIVVCPIDRLATGDRLRIRAGADGDAEVQVVAPRSAASDA